MAPTTHHDAAQRINHRSPLLLIALHRFSVPIARLSSLIPLHSFYTFAPPRAYTVPALLLNGSASIPTFAPLHHIEAPRINHGSPLLLVALHWSSVPSRCIARLPLINYGSPLHHDEAYRIYDGSRRVPLWC